MRKLTFLLFCNFSRSLKRPSIPIVNSEVQKTIQYSDKIQLIEKQVFHSQTIESLLQFAKALHQIQPPDTFRYLTMIFKRMDKLNQLQFDEFEEQLDILKISTDLLKNQQLAYNETILEEALKLWLFLKKKNVVELGEFEQAILYYLDTRESELKLKFGTLINYLQLLISNQLPLTKWGELTYRQLEQFGPDEDLKYSQLSTFYQIIDDQKTQFVYKKEIIQFAESYMEKFLPSANYQMMILFLKHRTFSPGFYKEQLMVELVKRAISFENMIDYTFVIKLNSEIIAMKYVNLSWFNYVCKRIKQELIKREDMAMQMTNLPEEVKKIEDFDLWLIKFADGLSDLYLTKDLILILFPTLQEVEKKLITKFYLFNQIQQLSLIGLHSILLECYYLQITNNNKLYKPTSKKKLEKLNNAYYETILYQLKELNFIETLRFLELASVLGLSKRKVCQSVFAIGIGGLQKESGQIEYDKKCYALSAYEKLLKSFVTNEKDFQQQIFKIYFQKEQLKKQFRNK